MRGKNLALKSKIWFWFQMEIKNLREPQELIENKEKAKRVKLKRDLEVSRTNLFKLTSYEGIGNIKLEKL